MALDSAPGFNRYLFCVAVRGPKSQDNLAQGKPWLNPGLSYFGPSGRRTGAKHMLQPGQAYGSVLSLRDALADISQQALAKVEQQGKDALKMRQFRCLTALIWIDLRRVNPKSARLHRMNRRSHIGPRG
jgi:hypothetical protein